MLKRRHSTTRKTIIADWSWQRHLEQKIKDSHFKWRNRDENRSPTGAPSKRKAKKIRQRKCQEQLRERGLHPLHQKRSILIWRCMRIQAWSEQERHWSGTIWFVLSDKFIGPNSKGDGKSSDDGDAKKAHQNLLVKICQGKRLDYLVQAPRKKLSEEKFMQLSAWSRMNNIQISGWVQIRRQVCIQAYR